MAGLLQNRYVCLTNVLLARRLILRFLFLFTLLFLLLVRLAADGAAAVAVPRGSNGSGVTARSVCWTLEKPGSDRVSPRR